MKKIIAVFISFICCSSYAQIKPIGNTIIEQPIIPGQTFLYSIDLQKGDYARVIVNQIGIDLIIATYTPEGIKMAEFDSPNGANGEEPVEIVAVKKGIYQLEVKPFDDKQKEGKFTVSLNKKLPFREFTGPVINWFSKNAVPVKSLIPGSSFSDLMPLKQILADVSIVGLGEATHGTHEFFTAKHRLIEFLVTEMNYRGLCVEASYSEISFVNDYIIGKTNTKPVQKDGWLYQTDEVDNLIEWMREYNKTMPESKKIQMLGIDPQNNTRTFIYLENYFHENIPEFDATIKPLFDSMRILDIKALNFEPTEVNGEQRHQLERMLCYLLLNRSVLITKTTEPRFDEAVMGVKLLLYYAEFNGERGIVASGSRDKYMTEFVEYHKQQFPANTKLIVWAHNTHISTKDYGFKPTGAYIKQLYGSKYYAIGFSFYEGSFLAQVTDKLPAVQLQTFTLPPSREGSIDWMLKKTNKGNAFFNLRGTNNNQAVIDWLSTPQRMYWVGGLFSNTYTSGNYLQPFTLKTDFDGLFFIEKGSPALQSRNREN